MRGGAKAFVAIVFAAAAAVTVFAANEASSHVPKPQITIEQGDKCVEDTQFMRRQHMNLLRHQRDETVHRGVRQARHSLQGCIDCHASRKTGSVIGGPDAFCEGCHSYASVKLDCFECHSPDTRPGGKASAVMRTGTHEGGAQ